MKDVLLILCGIFIFISLRRINFLEEDRKNAFREGYKRAKLHYECDHDRTECEVLTENY